MIPGFNMDTVIGDDLADILTKMDLCQFFTDFTEMSQQREWVKKYNENCFISCGLNNIDNTWY